MLEVRAADRQRSAQGLSLRATPIVFWLPDVENQRSFAFSASNQIGAIFAKRHRA
jgi:hypothetical protein